MIISCTRRHSTHDLPDTESHVTCSKIPYSGKLLSETTFTNWFCGCTQKFSLRNVGCGVLWCSKSEQSAKVFPMKIFTNLQKFSPSKVSAIYMVQPTCSCKVSSLTPAHCELLRCMIVNY